MPGNKRVGQNQRDDGQVVETAETEVWLDFASKCGCLAETDHKELREHYDQNRRDARQ